MLKTPDGIVHWHNTSNEFSTYCASVYPSIEGVVHLGNSGAAPTCLFCVDKGSRTDVYGLSAAMQSIIRKQRKP